MGLTRGPIPDNMLGLCVCTSGQRYSTASRLMIHHLLLLVHLVGGFPADPPDGDGQLFEGDIILTDEQRDAVISDASRSHLRFASGKLTEYRRRHSKSRTALWPSGVLYYEFARGEFTGSLESAVLGAMSDIERSSCVKFRPRSESDGPFSAYVVFRNTQQALCASGVGWRAGGRFDLFLSGERCRSRGTIQHELLHALGFWHEHTRPDRDLHVTIFWDNIHKGKEFNFMKRLAEEKSVMDMPYDYGSVMHYWPGAFSSDGKSPTIGARNPSAMKHMGQRVSYTNVDLAKLNRLYSCPDPFYKGKELIGKPSTTGKHHRYGDNQNLNLEA